MGNWTALTNQPPFNASQMLQLTDGTVMVQEEDGNDASRHWWRLTPDKFGSYIDGTWSKLADMANSRRFYASAVLADGRVLVAGREYSDAGGVLTKLKSTTRLRIHGRASGIPAGEKSATRLLRC